MTVNKKLYIKHQTTFGNAWADVSTGINIYPTVNTNIQLDTSTLRIYEQKATEYHASDSKMKIFKSLSRKTHLAIGIPTNIINQNVSISNIDLDTIFGALSHDKYESVIFAYLTTNEPVSSLDVITKSSYYARNLHTGKFENVVTGEIVNEQTPHFSLWYSVKQIGDTNIYYMVTNPGLVSILQDLDETFNGVEYRVMNTNDGSFGKALLNPSIVSGGKFISDEIIFATDKQLTIDTLGNSILHGFNGQKVEIPQINLVIESSVPYKVDNNIINLELTDKSTAYVSYKWITNTTLDADFITDSESLIRKHIIIS